MFYRNKKFALCQGFFGVSFCTKDVYSFFILWYWDFRLVFPLNLWILRLKNFVNYFPIISHFITRFSHRKKEEEPMRVLSSNLAVSKRQLSEEVRCMSSISISEVLETALFSDIIQLAFWALINFSIVCQWKSFNLWMLFRTIENIC